MTSTIIDIAREYGSRSSFEDTNAFRDYQKEHKTIWHRAEVDRFEGLALYSDQPDGRCIGLQFEHALCGYNGSGPQATLQILSEAGFGTMGELAASVTLQQHCIFAK